MTLPAAARIKTACYGNRSVEGYNQVRRTLMPDTTIYRHWIGALYYFLVGGGAMSALLYVLYFVPFPDDGLNLILAAVTILIGLVTIVLIYTYTLSHIDLDVDGIQYTKYATLFASSKVEADWNTVQSIEAKKPGIFAQLFGYGTLFVQTADADPNFTMTYVPNVDAVKELIDQHATFGAVA